MTSGSRASHHFTIAVVAHLRANVTPGHLLSGQCAMLTGRLYPAVAGRKVTIEEMQRGRWRTIREVEVKGGRFTLHFTPHGIGHGALRLRFGGDRVNLSVQEFAVMTVFRRTVATWYGPGFFGNSTACGHVYSDQILGVAHRTLPCGTNVTFLFNGAVLTVPVIDRGPYSSASWDLSAEAARRLGFTGAQEIGVLMAVKPGE